MDRRATTPQWPAAGDLAKMRTPAHVSRISNGGSTVSRKLLATVLAGCVLGGCAPTSDTPSEEDVAAVRAVIAEEVRAANAGDVEGLLALHTDDIVMVPPNEPAVEGASAVRDWEQSLMDEFSVAGLSYSDEEIVIAGDIALHYFAFQWTVTPKAGGDPLMERGHGVHVLHRQADGSWKLRYDIWSPDAPLPAM